MDRPSSTKKHSKPLSTSIQLKRPFSKRRPKSSIGYKKNAQLGELHTKNFRMKKIIPNIALQMDGDGKYLGLKEQLISITPTINNEHKRLHSSSNFVSHSF